MAYTKIKDTLGSESENEVMDGSLVRFGWAPGYYIVGCKNCGVRCMGDKRISRCPDCATNLMVETLIRESRVYRGAESVRIPFLAT